MSTTEKRDLMMRGVSERLKGKIAARAEAEDSNMQDVLEGVLSRSYGIPFTPSGHKRKGIGNAGVVNLKIGVELKTAIAVDAAARGEHERNVALEIICAEFGEPFVPTGARHRVRRRRGASTRPMVA